MKASFSFSSSGCLSFHFLLQIVSAAKNDSRSFIKSVSVSFMQYFSTEGYYGFIKVRVQPRILRGPADQYCDGQPGERQLSIDAYNSHVTL